MAASNPFLEGLRVKLARMQAGEEPNDKASTSIIEGMIKALEKADADAAKAAAKAAPPPPPPPLVAPAPPPPLPLPVVPPPPPIVVMESEDEEEDISPIQPSPIRLCLFDLDDTLLRTNDLDPFRGAANVNNSSQQYTNNLMAAYMGNPFRVIYTPQHHAQLRQAHPEMKWGVFTRAPRHYARTLLGAAYPGLHWDVVIAYEDVQRTKPHGDGVWAAMNQCGVQYVDQVALVGDEKHDIQAAYQGGCWSILDQTSWTRPWESSRYWAMERVPDAVIDKPSKLSSVLAHPKGFWPELEYHRDGDAAMAGRAPRFDTINHFFPRPDRGYVPITVLGRLFGEYDELRPRRQWHSLTDEIHAHKDAATFPAAWTQALRHHLYRIGAAGDCLVTVIPFKPGRPARLEALLDQVRRSDAAEPIREGTTYTFAPDLLAFRDGAVSSHGRHLTKEERFANVSQNLFVAHPEWARGRRIVVIDDVTTTGATLLWANRYLTSAGAQSVSCVSLTKAVGIG